MDFVGAERSPRQLEIIGLKIDPLHREDQADLMRTRWFEYRTMHPVAATYLFAQLYREQVEKFAAAYVDIRTADQAKAFTPEDIFYSRDMTGMWLARSSADRVGVPYEVLLAFAQQRALDRTFQRYPRPNQLYGEEFEADLLDHWNHRKGHSLQYSRAARFGLAQYHMLPLPEDVHQHADFIVDQILARGVPPAKLLGRMFKEDRLSVRHCGRFHSDDIEKAKRHAMELGCVFAD
jgi:hypothetical protein